MKKHIRIISAILALCMVLVLAGCGGGGGSSATPAPDGSAPADATPTPKPIPTAKPSYAPTPTPNAEATEMNEADLTYGDVVVGNCKKDAFIAQFGEPTSTETATKRGTEYEQLNYGWGFAWVAPEGTDYAGYVSYVRITDEGFEIPRGVTIGSSIYDAKTAYLDNGWDIIGLKQQLYNAGVQNGELVAPYGLSRLQGESVVSEKVAIQSLEYAIPHPELSNYIIELCYTSDSTATNVVRVEIEIKKK